VLADEPGLQVVCQPINGGNGASIQVGLARAIGEFVIVQDADLEYFPGYFLLILRPLLDGAADMVIGTRFNGLAKYNWQSRCLSNLGISLTNFLIRLLYGVRLTVNLGSNQELGLLIFGSVDSRRCLVQAVADRMALPGGLDYGFSKE
jgi:glycosyltransferase involved in cell wall biosynthesis